MRNIARFTGAHVTGITINKYQVNRGNELNAQAGLKNQCQSVQVCMKARQHHTMGCVNLQFAVYVCIFPLIRVTLCSCLSKIIPLMESMPLKLLVMHLIVPR